jgi:DNA-binding beta-propeller fold protein YncE
MNRYSLCLLTILLAAPAHAGTLYGVTAGNPGALHTINTSNGATTPVATLGGAGPQTHWSGLEFYKGLLYGIGFDNTGVTNNPLAQFVSIDPVTGATTIIAPTPNTNVDEGYYYALAVNAATGVFYSYNDAENQLYSITTAGVFTPIGGTAGLDWFDGFAFDPGSGLLYGVGNAEDPSFRLYTINTGTGDQTLIGSLGVTLGEFAGLAIDPGTSTLYLAESGLGTTNFYTVDRATGAATLFGSDTGLNFTGLAYDPVPEPATLALTGSAFGALLWLRRRRFRR